MGLRQRAQRSTRATRVPPVLARGIELRLYVTPERISEMRPLGWLGDIAAGRYRRDEVVGAALAGLVMRALRLRLRPKRRENQNAT